ncbi:hypothetical protein EDC17_101169 [Sphingobacterium alimentarium]|uniref:Uncharacterized protein n=1 Tax=Sphingobacterium alimentarium TaxID=797292 RepID=A0A4R3W057_9SPHI|nr:hypothetical protein EDC17_101169 [Sphingobacterium alimentarium]
MTQKISKEKTKNMVKMLIVLWVIAVNIILGIIEIENNLPIEYFFFKILLILSIIYIPKLWKGKVK